MKLADLPPAVIEDLCHKDNWRLDVDPGLDSKHEFWMAWHHFITLPEDPDRLPYQPSEADLAEFLTFDGFNVLLPVERTHHPKLRLIRLIQSIDQQTLTLLLHDSFHADLFDAWTNRYGFLAIADRYQKFGCDFYLASYYHFAYLLNQDYEAAQKIMAEDQHL